MEYKKGMRETCQAEALPPDTLAMIVKNEVMQYYDISIFDADVLTEKQVRESYIERFHSLDMRS